MKATTRQAVRHLLGQLPRNASPRERAERERIIEAVTIIRRHETGRVQPKNVVDNAYRCWRAALRREHGADSPSWERGHFRRRRHQVSP
jgi:hypothetical protein